MSIRCTSIIFIRCLCGAIHALNNGETKKTQQRRSSFQWHALPSRRTSQMSAHFVCFSSILSCHCVFPLERCKKHSLEFVLISVVIDKSAPLTFISSSITMVSIFALNSNTIQNWLCASEPVTIDSSAGYWEITQFSEITGKLLSAIMKCICSLRTTNWLKR